MVNVRDLLPLLNNSSVTSHRFRLLAGESVARRRLQLLHPNLRKLERHLNICRCQSKGNYFSSVIFRPWVLVWSGIESYLPLYSMVPNREKSLRHVAMVAKFLNDNKPKRHLKSVFALFQNSLILFNTFNLSNVGETFWVQSERRVCKFRKRKTKFLCCAHLLHKAGAGSFMSWLCNNS